VKSDQLSEFHLGGEDMKTAPPDAPTRASNRLLKFVMS